MACEHLWVCEALGLGRKEGRGQWQEGWGGRRRRRSPCDRRSWGACRQPAGRAEDRLGMQKRDVGGARCCGVDAGLRGGEGPPGVSAQELG